MNRQIINDKKIFSPDNSNKEELFMSNIMEKNRAKNFNEKSTNLSDNDDVNNFSSKSNQG